MKRESVSGVTLFTAVLIASLLACTEATAPDEGGAAGAGGGAGAGGAAEAPAGGAANPSLAGVGGESPAMAGAGAGMSGTGGAVGGAGGEAMAGMGGGGAGGSAGMAGTGGMVAGPDCKALSACEDFERFDDGAYPSSRFRAIGGPASKFAVVSDKASAGKKALKVTIPPGSRFASVLLQGVDKLAGGGKSVFARMMIRFEPGVPPTTRDDGKAPHWRLIRMVETVPGKPPATVSVGVVGANQGFVLYNSPGNDCARSGGSLPGGKWACVEMRADAAGYEMFIDGKSVAATGSAGGGCWQKHDIVQQVAFGFEIAAAALTKEETFWLDDLAVSDKRIGCP